MGFLSDAWNNLVDAGKAQRNILTLGGEKTLTDAANKKLKPGSGTTVTNASGEYDASLNGGFDEQFLKTFATAYPGSPKGWAAAVASGDQRSYGQWLSDGSKDNPTDPLSQVVNSYRSDPSGTMSALKKQANESDWEFNNDWAEYANRPEVQAWKKQQEAAGTTYPNDFWLGRTYYGQVGKAKGDILKRSDGTWATASDYNETGSSANGIVDEQSTEEWLAKLVQQRGIADVAKDAERQKEADAIYAKYKDAISANSDTINSLANGKMLEQELSNSVAADKAIKGALDTQTESFNRSIADALTAKSDALATAQAAKGTAITDQLATLNDANSKYSSDRLGTLGEKQNTLYGANADYARTLSSALNTQRDALVGSNDTYAGQRQATLTDEVAGLRENQKAMRDARVAAAQTQAAAINQGLQTTSDKIQADQASAGYYGGSSLADSSQVRAAIAARQQAGQAMSQANLANASDDRDISNYGTKTKATISNDQSLGLRNITDETARGQMGITAEEAKRKYGITESGANERAGILNDQALGSRDISAKGANDRRSLADWASTSAMDLSNWGTDNKRAISDDAAKSLYGISSDSAQRNFALQQADNARKISSLSLPTSYATAELGLKNSLDDYGHTGLTRTMNNLNWFKLGNTLAPTNQSYMQSANTAMNDAIAGVGGSIGNAMMSYGMATYLKNGTGTTAATPKK